MVNKNQSSSLKAFLDKLSKDPEIIAVFKRLANK
jgi:hypothetical protein